jgi:riboflavin kinase
MAGVEDQGLETYVPLYVRGTVVKGFGRGNKELGIPTANLDDGAVASLPSKFKNGIYFGWACVDRQDVHKMVMSIGVNPHFRNEKKSMVSVCLSVCLPVCLSI